MTKVYICSTSVATPLSLDWQAFCQKLNQGEHAYQLKQTHEDSPERLFSFFDTIPHPEDARTNIKLISELSKLALFLAQKLLHNISIPLKHAGVFLGSGFSNLYDLEESYAAFFSRGPRSLSPLAIPKNMAIAPTNHLAIEFGIQGPAYLISSACSSGAQAILRAWKSIKNAELELAICGGLELLNKPSIIASWEKMRVLSKERAYPEKTCLPFHKERSGFSLGEGGAFFLLCSEKMVDKWKLMPLAELESAVETSDGMDIVKPSAKGIKRIIEMALAQSHTSPSDIDAIQTHGTATILNDQAEGLAIKETFKSELLKTNVSAIKHQLGHTMGASGALALAASVGSLLNGFTYPMRHLNKKTVTKDINLAVQLETMPNAIQRVLINSFAFGGVNLCLVAKKV